MFDPDDLFGDDLPAPDFGLDGVPVSFNSNASRIGGGKTLTATTCINGECAEQPISVTDPIAVDLDGDGLEFVPAFASGIAFDLDDDGFDEPSAWVRPDDGLLALDANGNGVVDGPSEFVLNMQVDGADTDLEALASYDSNGNGALDAGDAAFRP